MNRTAMALVGVLCSSGLGAGSARAGSTVPRTAADGRALARVEHRLEQDDACVGMLRGLHGVSPRQRQRLRALARARAVHADAAGPLARSIARGADALPPAGTSAPETPAVARHQLRGLMSHHAAPTHAHRVHRGAAAAAADLSREIDSARALRKQL